LLFKIEFRVRVLGTPKPSIQWYKDDVEIFSCDRIEMKEEEEGGAVILKGARLSDSGAIKCVATNLLGKAVSAAQLIIEGDSSYPQIYKVYFIDFCGFYCKIFPLRCQRESLPDIGQ